MEEPENGNTMEEPENGITMEEPENSNTVQKPENKNTTEEPKNNNNEHNEDTILQEEENVPQEPVSIKSSQLEKKETMEYPNPLPFVLENQETTETTEAAEIKKPKRTVKKKKKVTLKKKRKSKKQEDEDFESHQKLKRDDYNDSDDLHRSSRFLEKEFYRRPPLPVEHPPSVYPIDIPDWRYDPWEMRRRLYSSRF